MSDVVLVEDDPDLQVLTSMLLESHGHVTRAFSSGQPALQACFVEPPEVVLLDWMLPEMTGIEILRELRANPTTAHVPVVMVTAQDRPENIATAFDNGAFRIVDRKKDILITSGGKNIAPAAVENALRCSPYISEVIVFGDQRKYISALIEIDFENVAQRARQQA